MLNKIDALDEEARDEIALALQAAGAGEVLRMSGVTGEGVTEVLRALRARIDLNRLREKKARGPESAAWQP